MSRWPQLGFGDGNPFTFTSTSYMGFGHVKPIMFHIKFKDKEASDQETV